MGLHHKTWISVLGLLGVLLALNLWCWRPGIGGGGGGRPPGTELELYYGWPATYQAEWWRSEDSSLLSQLLQTAPFCHPATDMVRQDRDFDAVAALADIAFGVAALMAMGVLKQTAEGRLRRSIAIVVLILAILVMVAVLGVSDRIEAHI
jgi:hypothetical protein